MKPLRLLNSTFLYLWGFHFTFRSPQWAFLLQPQKQLVITTLHLNTRRTIRCWLKDFNFQWRPGCLTTLNRSLTWFNIKDRRTGTIVLVQSAQCHDICFNDAHQDLFNITIFITLPRVQNQNLVRSGSFNWFPPSSLNNNPHLKLV